MNLVGDWITDAHSSFHNVSYPETPASIAFTFNGGLFTSMVGAASLISLIFLFFSGTQARAVGFVTFNGSPLQGWILGSGGPLEQPIELPTYDDPAYDDPNSGGITNGTSPPAFYTTGLLLCNQYTLNFTVTSDQAMQIKEFEFVPCTLDDDQAASASASTTAAASSFSQTSVVAAEKKHTLGAGAIVGAFLGALAVLLALGSLAFLIFLHRRRSRRRTGTLTTSSSSSSSSPSPSPFLIAFSRSRPDLQPKPSIPSAPFLASVPSSSSSSSSPASAAVSGGHGGAGGRTGQRSSTTTMLDAKLSGSSASAALFSAPVTMGLSAPLLPWLSVRSAASYPTDARDGQQQQQQQWAAAEKQPLRPDDDDPELEPSGGMALARGYLPDSKELMAWQEREQAGAQGTPSTIEALPRYQSSFRWSSKSFAPTPSQFHSA